MHLREGEYERAHTDFFEAFKNYDESGSPRFVVLIPVITYAVMYYLRANKYTPKGCRPR